METLVHRIRLCSRVAAVLLLVEVGVYGAPLAAAQSEVVDGVRFLASIVCPALATGRKQGVSL
ncbi:MAG: hypothetical protein Ct9H300mP25_05830 [Acidobacteriota bacterium]|nr:MAG: hypothetical protein Ct9H300mP25_05830 [Acidobacteriota bacterium]